MTIATTIFGILLVAAVIFTFWRIRKWQPDCTADIALLWWWEIQNDVPDTAAYAEAQRYINSANRCGDDEKTRKQALAIAELYLKQARGETIPPPPRLEMF